MSDVLFGYGYGLAASWALAAYFDPLLEARNVVAVVARGHHVALVQHVLILRIPCIISLASLALLSYFYITAVVRYDFLSFIFMGF